MRHPVSTSLRRSLDGAEVKFGVVRLMIVDDHPLVRDGLRARLAVVPGLQVIMPATPGDAKGLLMTAYSTDSPVLCLEHRWLYETSGPVPEEPYYVPIGTATVAREGSDVTIVAVSHMVVEALQAAEILAALRRRAYRVAQERRRFETVAICVLPDHVHAIW